MQIKETIGVLERRGLKPKGSLPGRAAGARERKMVGARNDKAHCTATVSRWIAASS